MIGIVSVGYAKMKIMETDLLTRMNCHIATGPDFLGLLV